MNDGKRIIPTFIIEGKSYANPRISDLTNLLDTLTNQNDENITKCSNGKAPDKVKLE